MLTTLRGVEEISDAWVTYATVGLEPLWGKGLKRQEGGEEGNLIYN